MEITQELLHEMFEYKLGNLYWKISKGKGKKGNIAGTLETEGYRRVILNRKKYYIHRLIFLMYYGYLPKYIDHINNNPLDNSIENLRECTLSENQHNRKLSKNNNSGAKGVTWDKTAKKWKVQVWLNNKNKFFGRFNDLELAALVAEEARNKYHGEFANHGNKNEVSR